MIFGTIGKRPQLNHPFNNSYANLANSADASTYTLNSTTQVTLDNADSEFGEYNLYRNQANNHTIAGVRVNNSANASISHVNAGGWISRWEQIFPVSYKTGGQNSQTSNYHRYTGGYYYHHGAFTSNHTPNDGFNTSVQSLQGIWQNNPSGSLQPNRVPVATGSWQSYGECASLNEIRAVQNKIPYENRTDTGNTGVYDGSAHSSYGGWGTIGYGGTNPIFMGRMRHKNCLLWLDKIPLATFLQLATYRGRIKI